jgi:hypothetical protein
VAILDRLGSTLKFCGGLLSECVRPLRVTPSFSNPERAAINVVHGISRVSLNSVRFPQPVTRRMQLSSKRLERRIIKLILDLARVPQLAGTRA